MNRTSSLSLCFGAALISLTTVTANFLDIDGAFDLDWSTIDGGGGSSSGGSFAVHGTIGQPDAGETVLSGGGFEVRGGFWAGGVTPAPTCAEDIALPHNNMVDIDDLVIVITHWGATGDDIADITGNNIVDIDDLVQVIVHWGMCP